jgi:hypothetical protein
MILAGFRESFLKPEAAKNRAEYVAHLIGIHVSKLYEQIDELGLKAEIRVLREKAGVSNSGRKKGAKYACSACGGKGHNARSPKCPLFEGPPP